ncbi:MAG: glycosyltransferase family 39 protein [Deltaproteobacteria bacterium]|nr:glycosyltransferase family 39 protein [Deltaproteobacteria bacterium]
MSDPLAFPDLQPDRCLAPSPAASRHLSAVGAAPGPQRSPARALPLALPAMLVSLVLLAPYAHKAFTVDDTLFLFQARQALTTPLTPAATFTVWSTEVERLSSIMPSGPITAWLLTPAMALGGAEWAAHLAVWTLFLLGLWATVALALRLGLSRERAAWAGLLVAATPVALSMAGTCMPDVPAFAFATIGLERLLAYKQERRLTQAVACAVALALGSLTRSHIILLAGVGALALIDDTRIERPATWRRLGWGGLVLLLGAPLLHVAVTLLTRDPWRGHDTVSAMAHFASWRSMDRTSFGFFTHWSVALPLALPWAVLRRRELSRKLFVFALLVGMALLLAAGFQSWWWMTPLFALGVTVLADLFVDARQRGDATQLWLLAWLLISLPVVVYVQLPPRYLVPSAPAVAILLLRRLEGLPLPMARRWLGAIVAVGLLVGSLILHADAVFAGLGRRAANELVAPRVAAGQTVWFWGHWGFQFYAERAGARPLTLSPPHPRSGDAVIVDDGALPNDHQGLDLPVEFENRVGTLVHDWPGPRLMAAGAGYFSTHWGFLPISWGTKALDRFDVYEVQTP